MPKNSGDIILPDYLANLSASDLPLPTGEEGKFWMVPRDYCRAENRSLEKYPVPLSIFSDLCRNVFLTPSTVYVGKKGFKEAVTLPPGDVAVNIPEFAKKIGRTHQQVKHAFQVFRDIGVVSSRGQLGKKSLMTINGLIYREARYRFLKSLTDTWENDERLGTQGVEDCEEISNRHLDSANRHLGIPANPYSESLSSGRETCDYPVGPHYLKEDLPPPARDEKTNFPFSSSPEPGRPRATGEANRKNEAQGKGEEQPPTTRKTRLNNKKVDVINMLKDRYWGSYDGRKVTKPLSSDRIERIAEWTVNTLSEEEIDRLIQWYLNFENLARADYSAEDYRCLLREAISWDCGYKGVS